MKLNPTQNIQELCKVINARFIGSENHIISGINEIHKVEVGDLVFVDHPKYYEKALNSKATTILINKEVDFPDNKAIIVSDDPFKDFNTLTKHYTETQKAKENNIHATAKIAANAQLGENISIGKNSIIHSGVVIYDNTVIGDNVIIHANTVLGADAFYFQKREGVYHKMYTCGRVIIEDNVEIGALCTVDRGVTGDTIIGNGSKLDNQVHVGHDTVIGKNCLFASQVGIAGCVNIEDNVTLWGQVGIVSDLTIGKNAVVLGQSGIAKSIEGDKTYFGSPADEAKKKFKELAMIKKLPHLYEKL